MQFGESASVTVTFVSVTLPVFVTVIVKFAVAPLAIVCDFGFFVIAIDGLLGVEGGGDEGVVTVERLVRRVAGATDGGVVRVAGEERPPVVGAGARASCRSAEV